ncbi:MAG: ComEA family DNA-binding protein [Microthrixaceae bacterium]
MRTTSGQGGFTLLELLVVVAVLGALSGVAVVGVNAFDDQAQSSVCAADARAIATAQEAALLSGGSYLDEDGLVKAGYLREASTLHDLTVAGELYSLTPVDACVDLDGSELASAELSDDEATEKERSEKAAAEKEAATRAETEKAATEKEEAAEKDAAAKEVAEREAAEKEAAAKAAAEKERAEKEAAEKAEQGDASSCAKGQVDLNSATHKELVTIDHVGGDEATRIIKQRPFSSLDQLRSVKGLSSDDVQDIRKEGRACV